MIIFDSLPSLAACNPNHCAKLCMPPAYSELHPVKSFALKSIAVFSVVMACLLLVSLVGWLALASNTSAALMMPFVVGVGVFAGFKIGDIVTEEIR